MPLVILGGAALSFYALIGFEDSVNVAEETRDPARAFPRALFGGLLVAGLIYFLVDVHRRHGGADGDLEGSEGRCWRSSARGRRHSDQAVLAGSRCSPS